VAVICPHWLACGIDPLADLFVYAVSIGGYFSQLSICGYIDDTSVLTSRRRLLASTATAVGLGGIGIVGYRQWSATNGDGDGFPVITTRDQLGWFTDSEDLHATREGNWELEGADELFVFIHGWGPDDSGARNQAETAQRAVDEVRPAPVVAFSWDGQGRWQTVTDNADTNAHPLAEWLVEWADEDGRPVHLIGYSLGARVACETVAVLADTGTLEAVSSVSLLGAAIAADTVTTDGRYGEAIGIFSGPVTSFFSENDRVLADLFDEPPALGQQGADRSTALADGFEEVDVTDSIPDHHTYYRPDVGCFPEVIEAIDEE